MSVSRVEYAAALKRVRDTFAEWGWSEPEWAKDLTLAALGLDEPPTEGDEREIERMARAIWASDGLGNPEGWDRTLNQGVYLRRARAAFDALAVEPTVDYRRGGEAFWGWLREHMTVEECEAVENAGVHPDDWAAAAECCVRAARGEHDHRPFTTCPDLVVVPPSEAPKATDDDLARFADWVERDRREPDKLLCHVASMRRRAFDLREPPAEPPKACPTCGSGWTYHHACPDRGSGVDGGTP